ncbi:MAG TPA: hypothetical protein VFS75_00840 [Candidatus Paceibacterota bacterium]|nr:hypothetical protein [Candidatus Paceibacterota bacterium]
MKILAAVSCILFSFAVHASPSKNSFEEERLRRNCCVSARPDIPVERPAFRIGQHDDWLHELVRKKRIRINAGNVIPPDDKVYFLRRGGKFMIEYRRRIHFLE